MRVIRNYILEEVFTNFISTLTVLTFVLLVGNIFSKMIDLVINRGVDLVRIAQVFMYSVPFLFVFTIPMSMLVAILLTFGRLSADHELVALRASGINLMRVFKPVLITAFLISTFSLYFNDQIASTSHFKVRKISAEIGLKTPSAILEEGVFIKSFKDIVLFIHRIEGNELKQLRIYQPQESGPARTIIAESGELIPVPERNLIKLKLSNGTSDEPDKENAGKFYKLKFRTYFLPLDISSMKFKGTLEKKRKELTLRQLWAQYVQLKNEGFIDHYLLTEINKKIALALSTFFLVWIAIPLAIRTRRGEKSIGFAIALIVGTVYWAMLIGMTSLAKTGTVPAWIAMQSPNLIMFLFGAFLNHRLLRS